MAARWPPGWPHAWACASAGRRCCVTCVAPDVRRRRRYLWSSASTTGRQARGHLYGAIVVDLEKHHPIELLAGRDAATVVTWLKEQPAVEVIARDRGGAYADAARTAAPDAQQVADRWHLLANLRDAFERLLLRCPGKLKEAARQATETLQLEAIPAEAPTEPADVVPTELPLKAWQRQSNARRECRLARYEEAVRRHRAGESIRAIGQAMNLDRRTVRSFVHADAFPERAQRAPATSLLDAHCCLPRFSTASFPRSLVMRDGRSPALGHQVTQCGTVA